MSEFIVTEPVGGVEQDDFLNGCLELETLYTPYELLDFLLKIEQAHKRERLFIGDREHLIWILFFMTMLLCTRTI